MKAAAAAAGASRPAGGRGDSESLECDRHVTQSRDCGFPEPGPAPGGGGPPGSDSTVGRASLDSDGDQRPGPPAAADRHGDRDRDCPGLPVSRVTVTESLAQARHRDGARRQPASASDSAGGANLNHELGGSESASARHVASVVKSRFGPVPPAAGGPSAPGRVYYPYGRAGGDPTRDS